jgi:hypothetical protein
MQKLQDELKAEGKSVNFLSVNSSSADTFQQQLIDVSSFPLLQDTTEKNVWGLQDGNKDDIYVYNADGTLSAYFSISGATSTILSTPEGYDNLKNAILDAMVP